MVTFVFNEHKIRIENNSNGDPKYVGEAQTGTATSATNWRIKLITYDANNDPTQVDWADSNNKFEKAWDDRATYSYG